MTQIQLILLPILGEGEDDADDALLLFSFFHIRSLLHQADSHHPDDSKTPYEKEEMQEIFTDDVLQILLYLRTNFNFFFV